MIRIRVVVKEGKIVLDADGHANYAPHGQDIVCASVSAILQTAVLGLEAIAEQYPDHVHIKHEE